LLVSGYWEGSKALRLDLDRKNGDGPPQVIWEGKRLCGLMSTPLCRDGHAYALDKDDGLKCIELPTGKIKWENVRITPKDRNPQASLVWVDAGKTGRALILNTPGELILADLSPAGYRQLAKVPVIDATWAHPAFADGCVFVRNDKEILCLALPRAKPETNRRED
jgi:hypothetical protein